MSGSRDDRAGRSGSGSDSGSDSSAPAAGGSPAGGASSGFAAGCRVGDYEILSCLGAGGMGSVYLARQSGLDRLVALKTIRPESLGDGRARARFESEARLSARLNHPNVAHVYAVGEWEGAPYLAMEYVSGGSVGDALRVEGRLSVRRAAGLLRQAAEGLAAAAELGLVHRDVKPENLLVTDRGVLKIVDFGLCREAGSESGSGAGAGSEGDLTGEGMVAGTPAYMSPEQLRNRELDGRSDVYSLGATGYRMLTGRAPFAGSSGWDLAMRHLTEPAPDPRSERPEIPGALAELIVRMMAKRPEDRPVSAREVARELGRIEGELERAEVGGGLAGRSEGATATATATVVAEGAGVSSGAGVGWLRWAGRWGLALLAGSVLGLFWNVSVRSERFRGGSSAVLEPGSAGLWLSPGWESTPRADSASSQYRRALTAGSGVARERGWLAVGGYHGSESGSEVWTGRAWAQLARDWFEVGDAERLEWFAADLERASGREARAGAEVAALARAGAGALRGDFGEVVGRLEPLADRVTSPLAARLALDVTRWALRRGSGGATARSQLAKLEGRYRQILQFPDADLAEALGRE